MATPVDSKHLEMMMEMEMGIGFIDAFERTVVASRRDGERWGE